MAWDDSAFEYGDGGQMPRRNDGTFPAFSIATEEVPSESAKAGRPIFKEVEVVHIHIVGDKNTVAYARVTDEHRKRWPREYRAFKDGHELATNGTPLEHWPPLKAGMVAEFKALNIRTVEDLAGLDENGIRRIGMGGRRYVEMAQTYLASAKDTAVLSQMQADKEAAASEIADLRRQVAALKEQMVADDEPEQRRGPGRPRKAA